MKKKDINKIFTINNTLSVSLLVLYHKYVEIQKYLDSPLQPIYKIIEYLYT